MRLKAATLASSSTPKAEHDPSVPKVERQAPATLPPGFSTPVSDVAVAGVGAEVPPAPAAPLEGTAVMTDRGLRGTVYDAQAYLADRLKITGKGVLRVFHHAKTAWQIPEERAEVRIDPEPMPRGLYGDGLYTSTVPELEYGPAELQLEIPVAAFAGKKIFETKELRDRDALPHGVDILAFKFANRVWFIFKPDARDWLNRSTTVSDFDKPGEAIGWS